MHSFTTLYFIGRNCKIDHWHFLIESLIFQKSSFRTASFASSTEVVIQTFEKISDVSYSIELYVRLNVRRMKLQSREWISSSDALTRVRETLADFAATRNAPRRSRSRREAGRGGFWELRRKTSPSLIHIDRYAADLRYPSVVDPGEFYIGVNANKRPHRAQSRRCGFALRAVFRQSVTEARS